ncbi:MAG: hypothetical protein ABSG50_00655 [Opitutaceae bacterium]
MKAYKFTKRRYYDRGSFRLGTLYDYRREEAYGSAIGDAREGTFDRQHSFDFKTSNALIKQLTSAQEFGLMYAKGEKTGKFERNRFVLNFTSVNLLVFSAALISDHFLFGEFADTDCCIEIDDFEAFCGCLVGKISQPIAKAAIRECIYGDRVVVNDRNPMPPLPFLKDKRYEKQREIRLCVQLYADPTGPITLSSLDALLHCRIVKSLSSRQTAR